MSTVESHNEAILTARAGKYLTFLISRERYAVEILKVQEIIGVPKITRVPCAASYIKGVINLRGKIIPVVDLRARFGITIREYDELTCIVIVRIQVSEQPVLVGVIVDTVLDVMDFTKNEIEPTPDYGVSLDTRYVQGIGRKKEAGLHVLLHIDSVVKAEDVAVASA